MSHHNWIGQTLGGRYQLEDLLGEGGMSAVYRATDPNLKRTVAVKIIHPHLSKDPAFVRRFEDEAAVVAQLKHSNVIQVYDFDNDGETYYMVFEYIAGEPLDEKLRRWDESNERMSLESAVGYATNVAEALEYAHTQGMIHRDVKPANIMIDDQGKAILMDFGISKIIGGKSHTATGAIIGTALYMSPEQVKGEEPDVSMDIYSLGTVLYEMVSGQTPFDGDSAMTIMMKHLNDPVPDLTEINAEVPSRLQGVIEKALAKDPGDRFQSAGEMAQALRDVLEHDGTFLPGRMEPTVVEEVSYEKTALESAPFGAKGDELVVIEPPDPPREGPPPQPVTLPQTEERRSRVWLLVAAAVVLILVGIGAVTFLLNGGDTLASTVPTSTEGSSRPKETPIVADPTETPLPTLIPPVGSSNIYVEYILDGSGSMMDLLGGKTKLAIAQEVLGERVATMPSGVHVGLRVYGHNIDGFQDSEASCEDIELVVPLQQGGSTQIISWLPGMQAQGMTPMSESIRRAAEDFTFEEGRRNVIVLISDGEETCGDDPAEVVLFLQELGIDFNIHVIGLDVDGAAREQLSRIASVAGGVYVDANSEGELAEALGNVNSAVLEEPLTPTPAPTMEPTATPFPEANHNPIPEGRVEASTTYSGFPAYYAVDGDPRTSWFSTGPEGAGVPSTYRWTGTQEDFIASITVLSNEYNTEPSFRTGFGFESLTVQVLDAAGTVVFESSADLGGTPDPNVTFTPNVVGRSVVLLFSGHESLDCGGFSELQIGVHR